MRASNGNWVAVELGWSWLLWLRARFLLLIHVESSQRHLRLSENASEYANNTFCKNEQVLGNWLFKSRLILAASLG